MRKYIIKAHKPGTKKLAGTIFIEEMNGLETNLFRFYFPNGGPVVVARLIDERTLNIDEFVTLLMPPMKHMLYFETSIGCMVISSTLSEDMNMLRVSIGNKELGCFYTDAFYDYSVKDYQGVCK